MNGVATVGSGSTGDSCCICAARCGSIRATPSTSAGLARRYVARDAMHLAMLLRLDEIGSVAVIVGRAGGGSGLGAAREDVCSDLMRSRHRVSKLLLRQGIRVIRCHWLHRAGCLSWGPLPAPRPA